MIQGVRIPILSRNGHQIAEKEAFWCDLVTFSLFREKTSQKWDLSGFVAVFKKSLLLIQKSFFQAV